MTEFLLCLNKVHVYDPLLFLIYHKEQTRVFNCIFQGPEKVKRTQLCKMAVCFLKHDLEVADKTTSRESNLNKSPHTMVIIINGRVLNFCHVSYYLKF